MKRESYPGTPPVAGARKALETAPGGTHLYAAPVGGADSEAFVRDAMTIAGEAGTRGDPPFGALLVNRFGAVVARASNRQVSGDDPTAHSEIELLRAAARSGHRAPLDGYLIVVNAEPCSMCAAAIVKTAPSELIYGAPHEPHMDPDLGVAEVFARARRPPRVIAGVLGAEAAAQIASFRSASSGGPID